jgi:DNA invertase Pin-like site-specific DNA recombinase
MRHKQRFFPPPGYVAQLYGYGRVSHKNQFEAGHSIPDQEARIKAYLQLRQMEPEGPFKDAQWAGMYSEPHAQSAFKRPFKMRPTGRELSVLLKPSDHIIVDKLDRIIRSHTDWADIDRYFSERGISLHIVNHQGCSIDGGSSVSWLLMAMQVTFSEYECMVKGERVRDARARLRAQKRDAGVGVPLFMEIVGCEPGKLRGGGGKRVLRDWFEPVIERLLFMRDELHMSWGEICITLYKDRKGLPFGTPKFNPRQLDSMYWFWKAWQAAGTPDINELKVGEFVDEYKRKS